jgi:RNA polymerase sigma-70 factor (ECF subfamily)
MAADLDSVFLVKIGPNRPLLGDGTMDGRMPPREDRLNRLYDKHNGAVRAYCLRRMSNDDVRDAVADVFAVAWRRLDDIPAGDALPWLYGVARRVVADYTRSSNRRRRLVARLGSVRPGTPAQPEPQVIQGDEYHQVHEALAMLREKDREILLLAAWEELSHQQIAEITECSPAAAAQRLHRAKQKLGANYRSLSRRRRRPAAVEGSESA